MKECWKERSSSGCSCNSSPQGDLYCTDSGYRGYGPGRRCTGTLERGNLRRKRYGLYWPDRSDGCRQEGQGLRDLKECRLCWLNDRIPGWETGGSSACFPVSGKLCILCKKFTKFALTNAGRCAIINKSCNVNLEVDRLLVCLAVFKTVVKG